MNHNEKVQRTLDALDLEFEVLSLVQQQSIMGGSGGSSGGAGGTSAAETLVNTMFGIGTTSSGGTFQWASGTGTSDARLSMIKLAETPAGLALLTKIKDSGKKINLACGSAGTATGTYDSGTDTLDISNFVSSNGQLAAHELFHAYADIEGDGGGSTSNETQAYLFQLKYKQQSGTFDVNNPAAAGVITGNDTPTDGQDAEEIEFGTSTISLLKNGYNKDKFDSAVGNFKCGSAWGDDPAYSNLTTSGSTGSTPPLIAQFL